ncbi:tryptophan halogenase family protein [Roseateles saccharophilus]|uniref:Tryptophan halogenase n=1 Tax=Roseateles saccharophilus TaxID=304 RepID=A0A4V2VQF8_ROSSA|nr:tryptophan halogenase family protein [Roseateles saccharophilus]MDG0833212.1 tryptophan 7-halogenase [Roseateles saccharophilus]TCU94439.1 tryptophan halogenase [Roseateles saccharophilus]
MDDRLRDVVVLGGGSAGWLVAALLAAVHGGQQGGLRVTLVESSEAPPIGVGEGTWPGMRDTLRRIGLSEADFARRCQVSFKQGSRFDGWLHGGDGAQGDRYYHPFMLPVGFGDADLVAAWLATRPEQAFADAVSPSVQVCEAGLAPKQVQTPEFGAVANYAYHFDAGLFGQVLREHATARLGVRHVVDHVDDVLSHENGDIAALQTRAHGAIAAGLFIDCSGLAARLIGQHFGMPLRSEREVLFNDAALALQVPYARPDAPLPSCTIATAWAKGWIWDIGLPARRGVGAVFSRTHAGEDEALAALQAYLNATGAPAERPAPRLIRFEPGYRERFWVRNCVAIGLSSGFIEPLEASALALVELSAARLCDELPMRRATMDGAARRFNDDFGYRWARVIDFLKLHYALSSRQDEPGSDYWRAHRDPATWPERLREQLAAWQLRPPARHDFGRIDEVFPAASYQYVLYGMGFRPHAQPLPAPKLQAAQACFDEAARQARRFLSGLPGHRSLIDHLHRQA